jgi:hypothetical protein
VLALTALSGCVTTQQRNARTVLMNERTIASETAVRVTRENPLIAVAGVALVHATDGTALAVQLRNTSTRPLTDLPISVGVTTATGRIVYLNRAPNIDYFDAHVPAIAAAGEITWVFTTRRQLATTARPFARVGIAGSPPTTTATRLPRIEVVPVDASAPGRVLRVSVVNPSGIPQYGLPVYAIALRAGRLLGAGRATIADLDGGARATLELKLLGSSTATTVRLFAPPTIFN